MDCYDLPTILWGPSRYRPSCKESCKGEESRQRTAQHDRSQHLRIERWWIDKVRLHSLGRDSCCYCGFTCHSASYPLMLSPTALQVDKSILMICLSLIERTKSSKLRVEKSMSVMDGAMQACFDWKLSLTHASFHWTICKSMAQLCFKQESWAFLE